MKVRRKPTELEAVQYDGRLVGLPDGLEIVLGIELGPQWLGDPDEPVAIIRTLEGMMIVSPGDWVMTGVRGEHWAVKPDVFEETYERSE